MKTLDKKLAYVPITTVADHFKVTTDSVRKNMRRGAIKGYKAGKIWMAEVRSATRFYQKVEL
jgi:hypothetical protein